MKIPGKLFALGGLLSLLPAVTALAQVSMPTWQVNNQHTGNNASETILTPANVSAKGNFVQLFAQPLNEAAFEVGQTMGQPLVLAGVSIGGKIRNVVYVATQHGRVYAFDADSKDAALATDKPLWKTYLVPSTDAPFLESDTQSPDIGPELALTTTPVIDPATGTLYVVAKTRRASDNPVTFHQYLYALDTATGNETIPHVELAASFAGSASLDSKNGFFPFNAQKEHLRCAMSINNADGYLYLAFASHTDEPPYHGDVICYDRKTLQVVRTFSTSRSTQAAGLWNSGAGTAFDLEGNMLLSMGNGNYDPTVANGGDWGESFIKVATSGTTLAVGNANANSWTPNNWKNIDFGDQDVGSGGLLVLPDLPVTTAGGTAVPHSKLMVGGGKGAILYLVDRSYLGGLGTGVGTEINPGNNDSNGGDRKFGQINNNTVQEILEANSGGGVYNTPAYFNGYIYCAPAGNPLEQRRFGYDPVTGTYLGTADTARTTPTDYYQSTVTVNQKTPFISSNGTRNGIVWSVVGNGISAFDATNVSRQLLNANVGVTGDTQTFTPYKWTVPTVVNGKVYVTGFTGGTGNNTKTTDDKDGYLFVFGLAPVATGAPADPTDAAAQPQSATSIRVSWKDNSNNETFFSVRRSTSPTGTFSEWTTASGGMSQAPANATSFVDTTATASTTYYYQVYAGNVDASGTVLYSHAAQTAAGTTTFPTYYENRLVAYWSFDDLNATRARDLTGNGHTGTLGSEAGQVASGIIGGCLFCHSGNNAQSQVAVSDAADLRFTAAQSFTVSAWVTPQSIKTTEQCVVVKSIEAGNSYGLYISAADAGGKGQWIARSKTGPDITSGTTKVATGAGLWTHVAMVQDGPANTRTLYVNGVKVGGGAAQPADGTSPLWMGKQNVSTAPDILDGDMDELRLYNRALAAAELPGLMGPPVLGAVSNQTHGTAGNVPLLIAPLAAKRVEPREGSTAGTYSLALTFSVPVTSVGGVTLETTSGASAVGTVGASNFDSTGTVMTVPLTGVKDGQSMYLHLTNVQPGGGQSYIPFNVLWGDVNGDNIVDYIDTRTIASAATSAARPFTAALSAYDLNCDGVVDGKDTSLAGALAGGVNLGAQTVTNVALCGPALASSQQSTGKIPAYAFDIDPAGTQWDSIQEGDTNPATGAKYTAADLDNKTYLMVDLGATSSFNTETINWNAGAKTYYVDVSRDLGAGVDPHPETLTGSNWSQRLYYEDGSGWAARTNKTDGIKTDVGTTCTGRYVRFWGITRTTQYGYAMYDFQVLGKFVSAASGTSAAAPVVSNGSISATLNAAITPYQIQATNSPMQYTASGLPAGLSIADATRGIISGAPTQTGTFNATISASNTLTGNNATLTVTVLTPYAAWQSQYFTTAEQANTAISGLKATPAGDGITNLMKYALGLNPKVSGGAGMPTVSTATIGGQVYLTLTYIRSLAASDLTFTPEVSSDLTTWTSGASATATVSTTNGADGKTQTVVVRDATAMGTTGATRRFIHLKVTSP